MLKKKNLKILSLILAVMLIVTAFTAVPITANATSFINGSKDYEYNNYKVYLNKTSITLGVGESYTLIPGVTPPNEEDVYCIWSTSSPSIVSINKYGKITAKKVGTATITIELENGSTATCKVTVKNAPSKISLNKTSLKLGLGETFDLNSTLPSGTASYSVKYSSGNSSIASVKEAGGLITAKGLGTAYITAKTFNGKTATCKVEVLSAPNCIYLNKTSITLGVGEQYDLNSSLPSGTASYSVKYISEQPSIASVKEAGGLVTAKSPGSVYIFARTFNNKYAYCYVTVKKAPTSISLNKSSITLGVGEKFDLDSKLPSDTASYSVKYTSGNKSVATVKEAGGLVTAKAVGTAYISAKTYNGKTTSCKVTVKNAPSYISLNKTSVVIGINDTFDLNSSLPSGTASYSIKYSSNNTSVASVKEAGGLITGKSAGTATITAKTYNGKTAKCTVTVVNGFRYDFSNYSMVIPGGWIIETYYDSSTTKDMMILYEPNNYQYTSYGYHYGRLLTVFANKENHINDGYYNRYTYLGKKNGYYYYALRPTDVQSVYTNSTLKSQYDNADKLVANVIKTFRFK